MLGVISKERHKVKGDPSKWIFSKSKDVAVVVMHLFLQLVPVISTHGLFLAFVSAHDQIRSYLFHYRLEGF